MLETFSECCYYILPYFVNRSATTKLDRVNRVKNSSIPPCESVLDYLHSLFNMLVNGIVLYIIIVTTADYS